MSGVDLKEYFERILEERDARYQAQFGLGDKAVAAALAAQEKATAAAFAASEKAIEKSESAQKSYNATHNDLLRKMEEMLPRKEADSRFGAISDKVDDLKASASEGTGKEQMGWRLVGIALTAASLISAAIYFALRK